MNKLVIDFKSKDSLEVINYFFELNKENKQDIEIHGIDLAKDNELNQAYYGLYYANRYGVGLEFAKRILDAYHLENQDINTIPVISKLYKEIGYDPNDIIDAIMEGDFQGMHEYIQHSYQKDEISDPCSIYLYNDLGKKEDTICGSKNIIEYLSK